MDIHFHNMGGRQHVFERPGSDIKKSGYLRKLKTMKKKFFVLRSTSSSGPARLEYYDTEKKFQTGGNLPKRTIQLHTCFNINRRSDGRIGRFGIVLYTVQDSFTILTESEDEQEAWLDTMLEYQNEYLPEGDLQKEHYEHVWQVGMQPRGLGQGKGNKGQYRMCLNSTTVSLFKVNNSQPQFVIQLVTIRAVAHHENSFWLAVGNYAATGPGEFWFSVEDIDVAKDMHTTILQYMNSVKDVFHKYQPFGHMCPREVHTRDVSVGHHDGLKDFSPPFYSSDLDEVGSHGDFLKPDFMSLMPHHGPHSSHPASTHAHNFSELQHLTHLPTVKEGGSGEGFLLSELSSNSARSCDFPRPEPALCLLSDSTDLPPRTYSLGSKPTKKFQGYPELGGRKGTGNEMSRATSAPHILKGRREREQTTESSTPAASPLSMSLKSDDSDSFAEFMPIRPRTASDSFNYRPRTSSFSKVQQTCRPRSSSYGQGKRPVININKLNLERAMMSQDHFQRASRESSLLGSFESLRVSRESLRRTSQELRQPGASNTDEGDMRGSPSPKMRNASDQDTCMDVQWGKRRSSPRCTRADSFGSVRSQNIRGTDPQRPQPRSQQAVEQSRIVPSNSANCSEESYVDMDYSNKLVTVTSQIQACRKEIPRHMSVDIVNKNKKSVAGRSMSMENVDTYFISELPLNPSKPRTGSCGSKDKQMLRPESSRKLSSASVTSSSTFSSSGNTHHQPYPLASSSVVTHHQPHPLASSSSTTHHQPHPVASSSVVTHHQPYPSASSSGVTHHQPYPVASSAGITHHQPHPMASSSGTTHHQPHPVASSSGVTHHQPHPMASSAGITHHQPHPMASSSGVTHHQPHPLASSSTRTFGSSDSIRKSSSAEKTIILGKDFRKKSGSTGSRPTTTKTPLGSTLGKEQLMSGTSVMPLRQPSTRFHEDEPAGDYIEFLFTDAREDIQTSQSSSTNPALSHSYLPLTYTGRSGPVTSSEGITPIHSNPIPSSAQKESSSLCKPTSYSSTASSHVDHQQQQMHAQRHHPNLATSSFPSQTKQISSKDEQDYMVCDVGTVPNPSPSYMITNKKVSEIKDDCLAFKQQVKSSAACMTALSGLGPASSRHQQENSRCESGVDSFPSENPLTPISAISYIKSNDTGGKSKLRHQQMSLEASTSVSRSASHAPTMGSGSSVSRSYTFDVLDQSRVTVSAAQYSLPPVPPLPSSSSSNTPRQNLSKQEAQDEGGYFNFCPSAVKCTSQDIASPELVKSGMKAAVPCTQISQEINSTSPRSVNADVKGSCQQQLRHQSQSFQRQLSAPACSPVPAGHHAPHHPTQAETSCTTSGGTSASDHKAALRSCITHLQLSETSNSSKTSCSKASPNSERAFCKSNQLNSDMSPCSLSSKNKCELSGSVISPGLLAELNKMPPSQNIEKFFYGVNNLDTIRSSETNVIPARAKARHSLGDIMSVAGLDHRISQWNRTNRDVPSSNQISRNLDITMGPRNRRSLSDLASCQQVLSTGLMSLDSKSNLILGHGSCTVGDNGGSGENSCCPNTDQLIRPLHRC